MPTKDDLIAELDKDYIKARKDHGATAEEIFKSLKNQILKENVPAIGLQIKLDKQMPADTTDVRHSADPDNPPKWTIEIIDAKKEGEET